MPAPLQPALIIGLGGSGIEIARRFRRRLHEDYPGTTHVRFLGIDTDPQAETKDLPPKLPDGEFHHAGNFAMQQFVGDASINSFPTIRAWWKGFGNLPFAYVATGAGQRRPIGRLALFVHFEHIRQAITRQLNAIFQADSFAQLPGHYRQHMTVYIVASTCGGTGTGMFLDLAYVGRTLVPQVMPQVVAPKLRGLLLMPSAFIGTSKVPAAAYNAMRANAYGALTELDWCMSRYERRGPVVYQTQNGRWPVPRESLAFDSCFLLGNQDAQGAVYTQWNELVERGSTHLHMTLASPIGAAGNSAQDNVESSIGGLPPVQGRSALYSSMNADVITLPVARIKARWTKRFARKVAERLQMTAQLGGQGAAAKAYDALVKQPGYGWLVRHGAQEALRELVPSLPAYESAATVPTDSAKISIDELVHGARALDAAAQSELGRLRLTERADEALRAALPEIKAAVVQAVSEGSIDDGMELLRRVRDQLDKIAENAKEQRHRLPADWLGEFGSRLKGVKSGIFQRAASHAANVSNEAVSAVGTAKLVWERALWNSLLRSLDDATGLPLLRTQLEQHRRELEEIRALLPNVAASIESDPGPQVASGMPMAISDSEADAAFDITERQERLHVFAREQMAGVLEARPANVEGIGVALRQLAAHAVHHVAEDFLASSQIRPEQVAERMDRLQPLAVFTPQWNALTNGAVPPPQRLSVLGLPSRLAVEEQTSGAIRTRLQGQSLDPTIVDTGESDRVLMIAQHHGFPLFALAELEQCRQAYNADPASKALRFTLPEDEARRWSVEPASASESVRWFAVALALGQIRYDAGLGGYVFESDALGRRELCHGESSAERSRQVARDEFLRQGLSDQVQHALGRAKSNLVDVRQRLDAWLTTEQQRATDAAYPEAFREDLREVGLFLESIRWVS